MLRPALLLPPPTVVACDAPLGHAVQLELFLEAGANVAAQAARAGASNEHVEAILRRAAGHAAAVAAPVARKDR